MVAAYFERMSGRCNGDFAHTDGKVAEHAGHGADRRDCLHRRPRRRCAAALLFVSDGKTFSAVMQETPPTAEGRAGPAGCHGFGGGTSGRVKNYLSIRVIPSERGILMLAATPKIPRCARDDTLR